MVWCKKLLPLVAFTTILLVFGVQPASADVVVINVPSGAMSSYPPDYGYVSFSLIDPTHATITFTALGDYAFAGDGAVALNVNGRFQLDGDISYSQASWETDAPGWAVVTPGSEGVFGVFDFALSITGDTFQASVRSVTFTLEATGGNSWASATDLVELNSANYFAAAHMGVLNSTYDGFQATGFVGDIAVVPDGGTTALLLGLALATGGLVSRRNK